MRHPPRIRFALNALAATALLAAAVHAAAAGRLRIMQPAEGETIHDNNGTVTVRVAGGDRAAGYRADIDGAAAGPVSLTPVFVLTDIDRGEHRLTVTAVDGDGQAVETSPPVTFNMWRASRLFPNRQ
ncbi:hypothetical protein G3580_13050 [Nitrogeniibacter mangrovi]|uniref:Uncharacterized protein n=1 Tax=Nitrogeniibacter mangrovi TaxID=2016596 RepID=A0A6C1B471_9RHOO|nr:hypothetical protein [Nitrogeniibacter mangrovi]QID18476.1 hypothetical protein G3580_13050 [Nitrogeniibacter mangrovi]